jgi:hypothetical protein
MAVYRRYFFYSDKKERWIPCRDEESCIEMDAQGFQVKMVVYEGRPPRMPKSEKKRVKKKMKNRDRRRSGRRR